MVESAVISSSFFISCVIFLHVQNILGAFCTC